MSLNSQVAMKEQISICQWDLLQLSVDAVASPKSKAAPKVVSFITLSAAMPAILRPYQGQFWRYPSRKYKTAKRYTILFVSAGFHDVMSLTNSE